MDLTRSIGLPAAPARDRKLTQCINLKLAALGCPTVAAEMDSDFQDMAAALLARHRETERLLANYLCPADRRIQDFLYDYLQDAPLAKLPARTFVLERHGMARALSLPATRDEFCS